MKVNEQFVRTTYPEAVAGFLPPEPGTDRAYDHEGHWEIKAGGAPGSPILGRGSTEAEAWANASKRIRDAADVR
jgi:hypothetical protein